MKTATEQDYHERIVRTLVYIQGHLDDSLDLEQVASQAAFSRFHFHRIFHAMVGEPLKEYVRRLRLERAARDLKLTGEPIARIALDAGFETHESFTRAFSGKFHASPSTYRAAYQPPDYGDIPPVEIRELPPIGLVFLRHVGPYHEVGATWGRLMSWAGRRGLPGPGMKSLGIVHDDPEVTPAGRVRYDAAVTVSRRVQPEGDVGVMDLPGGRYAVVTHRGPYEQLGGLYPPIYGGWLPRSGYELRDSPAFEQYVNSPQNTRPEELVTLIHIPVEVWRG